MSVATIFVPHQDDEINLVGNILSQLVSKYEVYIVYSSLESDTDKGNIRREEAINACSIYSINKNHVIFMGYPDTANKQGHHYYTDGDKSIVLDIEILINRLRPELIIGTDFDFHSDHRMLSLALDEALRNVILIFNNYRPRYLKGFCYETAYYGVDDYSASSLAETVIKNEILGNVSYRWEDRVSINSSEADGFITQKRAYKALKCHKSQYAILHARSIINADNVFWEKRTDNLLLNKDVRITAASGNVSRLNDFKVIDTDDIITIDQTKVDYSKGLWMADENRTEIRICWLSPVSFDRIVFHGNPNNPTNSKIKITILDEKSGKILAIVESIAEYGRATEIIFEKTRCVSITLICESAENNQIELSEIEVYDGENNMSESVVNVINGTNNKVKVIDYIDKFMFKVSAICTRIMRKMHNIKIVKKDS